MTFQPSPIKMQDMRQDLWNIPLPKTCIIGADLRLTKMESGPYFFWEIRNGWDEFKALSLHTDLGAPERLAALYPVYSSGHRQAQQPADFPQPPVLKRITPNFLAYDFSPLPDLKVQVNHIISHPQGICTRYTYTNLSAREMNFQCQLVGISARPGKRIPFEVEKHQGRNLLVADLQGKFMVVFLDGGSEAGINPSGSLRTQFFLVPGETRQQHWITITDQDPDAAVDLVFSQTALDWNAEKSRIAVLEESRFRIKTGNPSWDFTIALSQKEALLHTFQIQAENHPTAEAENEKTSASPPVLQRNKPLSPLMALHLLDAAAAANQDTIHEILERVFSDLSHDPAKSDQGQSVLQPLTSVLLWQAYSIVSYPGWIKKLLPRVKENISRWFSGTHDQDCDGIPEWSHPSQFELLERRMVTETHQRSLFPSITTIEDPTLAALLARDLESTLKMTELLHEDADPGLVEKKQRISDFLNRSWNEERGCFLARDYLSHRTQAGELLLAGTGPGIHIVRSALADLSRITFRITSELNCPSSAKIILHGIGADGQYWIEEITAAQWLWIGKVGFTTSSRLYSQVNYAAAEGIGQQDSLTIYQGTHIFQDVGELLPLWGWKLQKQQQKIFKKIYYSHPDSCWTSSGFQTGTDPALQSVQMIYNRLIGEGLWSNGLHQEAADLFQRLLDLISDQVVHQGIFFSRYDLQTGRPHGRRSTISGLLPIRLFLQMLGVKIHNQQVTIEGKHAFPMPISLAYRGVSIIREKSRTIIHIPGEEDRILPGSISPPVRLR